MAHRDCLESQQCVDMKCADPCPGACAHNSYCQRATTALQTGLVSNRSVKTPAITSAAATTPVARSATTFLTAPANRGSLETHSLHVILKLHTQCLENDDCPSDRTCVKQKCEDPCHNVCSGNNTSCQVRNHIPYCTCKQGFIGDPLTACKVQHVSGSWAPYPGAKKRYEVVSDQLNWYGAVIDCKNRGGRLATILSDEENEMARQKTKELDSIDYFWVSGINIDKNTTWMWATTGRPFTFTDWIDNQPDNWKGNEHCLMLNTNDLGHIWNDYDCLSIINYICEYYD
ncbi:C-type lectin domain family 18 member A-like [Homalodisca vitripennis]|uniref:C-type lectin domain family 18 member A-like n=1 Tax=Homalodisca vitripennis TaxID=197043 RepID=UPI001EEB4002|nr:C-type lectin domain family 18 member A-like [Homalodisca vitripennis]